MRVLFVSSSSGSRGGGELYLIFLGEALTNLGIEVGLWCSTHSRMDELADSFRKLGKVFRSEYKNTYDYKLRSLRYLLPKKIEGIVKAIDDFHPDIVHLNKQNIEDGLDLLITLDKCRFPYVTTIHITQTQKSLGALLGGWRDAISKKIFIRAHSLRWICISPNRSEDMTNFIGDDNKTVMIPNGVRIGTENIGLKQEMKNKLGVPAKNLALISVGRLESQKDPFKFIDWAQRALRVKPELSFFWIGDGTLRMSFEEKIRDLRLHDSIKCVGWQKDVTPFYAMADIYIHTAQYEGLPFSLLEAMSNGLPCVIEDLLFEDLAFPVNVANKGWEGLQAFISRNEDMTKVGLAAQEYVRENFSMEAIAKSYVSIYESSVEEAAKSKLSG